MWRILLPFSWIYGFVMWVRNWMFDHGVLSQRQYDIPVISIGNLAVGGTGKTPHVEKILRMLSGRRVAVVSRGYGRKTHGFLVVESNSRAEDVGDEPLQMKRKFPEVTFVVDENRCEAIECLIKSESRPEFVVLDDAFQHRYVKPWMQILLTDYSRLFTQDHVMPAGRLREFKSGYRRADLIIVTKCPEKITLEEARKIKSEINHGSNQKVLFTSIVYKIPAEQFRGKRVVVLTGIARPEPLIEYVGRFAAETIHLRFADHHSYTQRDIERICKAAETADMLVTTEKDAMRLENTAVCQAPEINKKLQIIPIEVKVLFRKTKIQ